MDDSEDAWGGLVNRRALPGFLIVLTGVLLLLSFFVGWFSIDAKLRRWTYDENNPSDFDGAPLTPTARIDLEMRMLSIDTSASPSDLQRAIEAQGEPTYDDHAGRMGTVMLGVLLMQFTTFVCFFALVGFYFAHRRGKRGFGRTIRRLFMLFAVLVVVGLLYFSVGIGPAARDDEQYILEQYPFSDQVAYASLRPDIGFWKTWTSDKVTVSPPNSERQVWEFEVKSNPSAGWWLTLAALLCAVGARMLADREGLLEKSDLGDAASTGSQPFAG